MAKWTLTKTTQDGMYNKHKKVNETVYHYESGDRKVAFHSHPTIIFGYTFVGGDKVYLRAVSNKFVEQGMKQHAYAGGFHEAINELEV